MTEEEIASLFQRVACDLDVPRIGALVSGAERTGRRVRRRRRAVQAAGSVLVAGAIVVAGTTTGFVPRLTRALSPASSPTVSPTASVSPRVSPSPSVSPSSTSTPSATMTATQIVNDLRSMLPATSTISDVRDESQHFDGALVPEVEFDYNDGHGQADFVFSVDPPGFHSAGSCSPSFIEKEIVTNESPRPSGAPPASCVSKTLPDGSQVTDWVTGDDSWGFYDYEVVVAWPDGDVVQMYVANGTILPSSPSAPGWTNPVITRAVPPGSFAQWNAIAGNPLWQR